MFENISEKNSDSTSDQYLSLLSNRGVIRYQDKGDIGNKAPEDLSKCKRVQSGDFVLNSMNFGIGSFGVSPLEGVCSSVYLVLRPKEGYDSRFLAYFFELPQFQKAVQELGDGILEHRRAFRWDDIKNVKIAVPPLEEQRAIADYLDNATQKYHSVIGLQTQLAELSRDRQEQAFAASVFSNFGKRFDGGWFQYMPEGWRAFKIRELFRPRQEKNRSGRTQYLSLLAKRGLVLYEDRPGESGNKAPLDLSVCKLVEPGDFVLNSMNFQIGSFGVSGWAGICSSVYVVLEPQTSNEMMKYLELVFAYPKFQQFAQSMGDGILDHRRAIGWQELKNLWIPVPPDNEVEDFIYHFEKSRDHTQSLIARTKEFVSIVNERSLAEVTAAVTGQIDVRGKVA